MDSTIPRGTRNDTSSGDLYVQRSSHEAHQNTNLPSTQPPYRTQIPFHQRNGIPKFSHNQGDQWEGQSSGPTNEIGTHEYHQGMEESMDEWAWLDQILHR